MTPDRAVLCLVLPPGMAPGAPRRNVLVGIGYLFLLYVVVRIVLATVYAV